MLEGIFKIQIFDRAIDVFGNASLSLYLAMALLSLKLWQLADLAGPLVVILGAQTLTMALYPTFITFRVMGKNYDAAVLARVIVDLVWVQHQLLLPTCKPLPICMDLRIKPF